MPKNSWTPIAITPLSGALNTRSRPADLTPGEHRYKLNLAINRTGSLCVRNGHTALNFGSRLDNAAALTNWDYHRRDTLLPRGPVTFLFESTDTLGVRRLFAGTSTGLAVLDNSTSQWHVLSSGWVGAIWKAAVLVDTIVFTNGLTGGVTYWTLTDAGYSGVGGIAVFAGTSAKVAITFSDVVMLMNVDGISSRVRWSDYKVGTSFVAGGASIAGFQDLDYGDEILNAVEMMGGLYIFTTRSIWRCVTNVTATTIFAFQKIYSEPKNQSGCLTYVNTLITTGRALYWLGRDTIWMFNPYIVAPESPDWLLKGTGAFFSPGDPDRMEKRCCDSIVAEYHPLKKEMWISYPQGFDSAAPVCLNNRCLVVNTEFNTIDLVDHGYTALANFRQTPGTGEECNADQVFIGASNEDYCLKNLTSDVYYRELVTVTGGNKALEIPDANYATTQIGYFCRMIGTIPLGYTNRKKTVREFILDSEVAPNALADANLITLRIGNSFALQDPGGEDAYCAVQWHDQESIPLACPDTVTVAAMAAEGQNPSDPLSFTMYEEGNYLYYDLRITDALGNAPKEHSAAFSAFRFDTMIN